MGNLITLEDYSTMTGVPLRTLQHRVKTFKLPAVKKGKQTFVTPTLSMDDSTREKLLKEKKVEWDRRLETARIHYQKDNKATAESSAIIKEVNVEAKQWAVMLGIPKIKGYSSIRSLQVKVQKNLIQKKTRNDKFKLRRQYAGKSTGLSTDAVQKAIDLVSIFFEKDPLKSLENAVDRALYFAEQDEEYWEVKAINVYTLRRLCKQAMRQAGFNTLVEFFNHYNIHRKKLAYVKGSFIYDIGFKDVYSLDDHKFDIAGVLVWDEVKGEFVKKHIYSWFVVDLYTMYPLAYEIKTTPFTNEDIVRLLMKTLKQHGKPNVKIICDQGLAADPPVIEFCNKAGIILEPQEAYSPTKKAPNERIFKFCKNEADIYNENFTGSNHPVEGRHRTVKLSPEETTELENEAIKRYDHYVNGYLIDRPRKLPRIGTEHLQDNTHRVSIRTLYDHFMPKHEFEPVDDRVLRYAYMKSDIVKNFNHFYITFKKEMYLPVKNSDIPLAVIDPAYKVKVAYDPADLKYIDVYAMQDTLDSFTGNLIEKGKFICTLERLDSELSHDEKASRVYSNNRKFQKKVLELAGEFRSMAAQHGDIINKAIKGDGSIVNVRRDQEKEIANIIKNAVPLDKIQIIANSTMDDDTDVDAGLANVDSLNDLSLE